MDDITSRTFVIAVNIFVTLLIITTLILTFSKMSEIYGGVATTNNAIYDRFDNVYSMYDLKEETGLGLLNTIKKYEDDTESHIIVEYLNSSEIKEEAESKGVRESDILKDVMEANENGGNENYKGTYYKYQDKYNVTVSASQGVDIVIHFERVD